ncbi:hypothetical protein [Kitasatospora purpeofusca]
MAEATDGTPMGVRWSEIAEDLTVLGECFVLGELGSAASWRTA